MSWFSKSKPSKTLFDAIARRNVAEIARFLSQQDFTLIQGAPDDDDADAADGSRGAVTGEFDDYPVLVAFTSNDHAATFAGANEDLLNASGELPAFAVGGSDLLRYLPEGFGIVFNPATEDEQVIPPPLARDVRTLQWG